MVMYRQSRTSSNFFPKYIGQIVYAPQLCTITGFLPNVGKTQKINKCWEQPLALFYMRNMSHVTCSLWLSSTTLENDVGTCDTTCEGKLKA